MGKMLGIMLWVLLFFSAVAFCVFFYPPPRVLSGLRAGPRRDTSAAAAGESAIVVEGRGAEGRLPGRCLRGKEGRKRQKLNDEYGAWKHCAWKH